MMQRLGPWLGDYNRDACESSRLLWSRNKIGGFEVSRGKSQVATQRNKEDTFLLIPTEMERQKTKPVHLGTLHHGRAGCSLRGGGDRVPPRDKWLLTILG